jgi:Methylamine utilisation protein MauE
VLVIRIFFIVLLSASAAGKLLDIQGFYDVVATYRLLPVWIIPWTSAMLIATEISIAAWLLVGRRSRLTMRLDMAALALIALHWAYLDWLAIALLRDLDIPNCGCFGVFFARPLTAWTLIEDVALLFLAFVFWRSMRAAQRTELGNEN